MACSKVDTEPKDLEDPEDLIHLTFKEYEGTRVVRDTMSDEVNNSYSKPLKFRKINIGSEKHPKMASMGDCWDD